VPQASEPARSRRWFPLSAARLSLLLLWFAVCGSAQSRRLVVIKVDGLGEDVVERWLELRDAKTGKSVLPWIKHVFVDGGAWLKNFYVRGISLSAPSWSMLDSGHHLVIRGNAEYDRASAHVYDYLNFFPFYLYNARNARADMPAVEVLDESGIPLLIDRYPFDERLQGMQLFQRGVRWRTLKNTLPRRFGSRSMRQLFNEWQTGFGLSESLNEQIERELKNAIAGDKILYLDYFFGDYDHVVHLANDLESQRHVMEKLDAFVGRIWSAIEASPFADETTLALISDHGLNSDPSVYSQGYNLIDFFTSAAAGGHHVITNRHPLTEYKLKGLDPFVSEVVTPSRNSLYLQGEAESYPTALLDLDGNERAGIYLRNSDINEMHLLLKGQPDPAAADAVLRIIDRRRGEWQRTAAELTGELAALKRAIDRLRATVPEKPKFTADQIRAGFQATWRRQRGQISRWERQWSIYSTYRDWLNAVLKVTAGEILDGKASLSSLVPRRAPLDRNTLHQLRNYVVNRRGTAFDRVNYLALLTGIRVRNNVQEGLAAGPVDFVALPVKQDVLERALPPEDRPGRDGILLYASEDRQALILVRERGGGLELKYVPVGNVEQDDSGRLTFERLPPGPGFPLRYFEDPAFAPGADAAQWLAGWHSEQEWFEATHQTRYSNGIIGLSEQFGPVETGASSTLWDGAGDDAPLLRRFAARLRTMAEADLLVIANDHWNFNVRGFNPGGNHGSFLRISTHSVLMMAGAGVRRGVVVNSPYDSLCFVPTVLELTGRGKPGGLPGPVVREVLLPAEATEARRP
jgi:hypothetical protein